MEFKTMTISTRSHGEAVVRVLSETEKAIKLGGMCSSAWFPKSAIHSDGEIASWFNFRLEHFFLFDAPYTTKSDFVKEKRVTLADLLTG